MSNLWSRTRALQYSSSEVHEAGGAARAPGTQTRLPSWKLGLETSRGNFKKFPKSFQASFDLCTRPALIWGERGHRAQINGHARPAGKSGTMYHPTVVPRRPFCTVCGPVCTATSEKTLAVDFRTPLPLHTTLAPGATTASCSHGLRALRAARRRRVARQVHHPPLSARVHAPSGHTAGPRPGVQASAEIRLPCAISSSGRGSVEMTWRSAAGCTLSSSYTCAGAHEWLRSSRSLAGWQLRRRETQQPDCGAHGAVWRSLCLCTSGLAMFART